MPQETPEAELVRAFVHERDEVAFRVLYRRETPVLFRLALRLLDGRTTSAEDAVQETWVRAAARMSAFRFESSLRTWLVGILLNCCHEDRRRRARPVVRPEVAAPERAAAAEPARAIDLEQAIAALARGYRRVLLLHDLMGYTHREIAQLLGVDPGTSKSQLFLARRALRLSLDPARSAVTDDGHE